MNLKEISIKTKLITILSLILFFAFLAINTINYKSSRKLIRENIINNTLPLTSDNIYSEIQKDLMSPIFVSSLMANDTFLKDWVLGGEKDIGKITKYLHEIKERYHFFSTFMVSEKSRNYYHFNGVLKKIDPKNAHDIWYYNFLKQDTDYDLDVDTNEATNNSLTIFINHRLLDYRGNLIGVTGAGLNVDHINTLINRYQEKYYRNIYFVDPDGMVQLHIDKQVIEKINIKDQEGIGAVADKILASKTTSTHFEFNRGDKTILLTARYIPEFDWFLIIELDETLLLQKLKQSNIINFIFGLIVTCCVIAINIFTVNHFQSKLERMATTDKLTGAFNRRAFRKFFDRAVYRAGRENKAFSLIIFDIDHFKNLNDTAGHLFGDKVLKEVSDISQNRIREDDVLARWGGDEFVVLSSSNIENTITMAERLRLEIEGTDFYQGLKLQNKKKQPVTITCGVAEYRPQDTLDLLIARADAALYRAKERGRNQTECEPDELKMVAATP